MVNRRGISSYYPTIHSHGFLCAYVHIYTYIYYCVDIHLHTHVRACLYLNTYTHYPFYLVYLFWPNKQVPVDAINFYYKYYNFQYDMHSHISLCFFFIAIAKLLKEGLFILSSSSVLISFIVLCNLWHIQFSVGCIGTDNITMSSIMIMLICIRCKVKQAEVFRQKFCVCICKTISGNLVKPNRKI